MKITIAGLGIREARQITLETISSLNEAKAILVLPIVGKTTMESLATLTDIKIINLKDLYVDGTEDLSIYENILKAVMLAAEEFKNIALLVPGHPRIGVTLVTWLQKLSVEKKFELVVLPGISSFCTIINDLAFDPLERGTLMADANRLLLFQNRVDPSFNLLVYHICSVGTSKVAVDEPLKNNRLDLLKSFLVATYGPKHKVSLVSSSTEEEGTPLRIECSIENLETCYSKIHYGTTLFVPAKAPEFMDKYFLSLLEEK